MSVDATGFKSGAIFQQLKDGLEALPSSERDAQAKKVNAVFLIIIKNSEGKEQPWTLDFKKGATVTKGQPSGKADITIRTSDETFQDLSTGKLNGQKAFMSGKLKVTGNIMLATRLDSVLKVAKAKL
ncbi:hypothetical protein CXG81DRAFT_14865 [Caulochytrium protostelioides]|uniref:Sterol-binding-like protein n=1 Tax=Caulochytrium protostelioides TaxID=1555241 RepID=A0A4P9X010_9FUNG|nr:sterol-binding-like protein [Caulochytrium protostelioides]RKO99189.1 hypothetical protein CXG81DRAFT_14865 [Caulochytrium protostelioides]|eukprot:RKO99189.1 hypothetical protein CXG81DRAFT_14865 [Caulochytrium protostelioides]